MAGFNLGDIIVTIKAKTDDLQKGLSEVQNMAQQTKVFGDKMGAALESSVDASKKFALGVAAAGTAAVAFGVVSVKAFADSQDKIAQTNAVLKSTGGIAGVTADQVTKLATALEKTTKFSDEDVRSVENLLLTFTSIGKDIFPQATKTVLDMATALGEDTKSASIQLGKALQDPVLGVTALRRVGVNFNDSQKEVIKNLVDTGQSAKAQQLIMAELTREFGGSAEAAGGTFAGGLAKLKNQLNNVQEALGQLIVKYVEPFLQKIMDWFNSIGGVDGVMKKLGDTFNRIRPYFGAIVGLIIGGLIPAFVAWTASIVSAVAALAPFLIAGAALGYLWNKNKLLFYTLTGILVGFATAIFVSLLPGIIAATVAFGAMAIAVIAATWPFILAGAAIAAGAYLIISHWSTVKDFLVGVWQAISSAAVTAWQWIYNTAVSVFNGIWSVVGPIVGFIGDAFMVVFNIYKFIFETMYAIAVWVWQGIYGAAIKPVIDWIAGAITWLKNVIVGVWQAIWAVAGPIFGYIGAAAQNAWNWIAGVWGGAVNWFHGIFNGITGAGQTAANSVGGFFNGLWEGIKGGFKSAANWIIGKANALINSYNNTVGRIPGTPNIGNMAYLAKGTENFAGGGAVVGEDGPELGLFPSGTKIVPRNLTANLVDNLMNVGDMLRSLLSTNVGAFVAPTGNAALAGTGPTQVTQTNTLIVQGDIADKDTADYVFEKMIRNQELAAKGLTSRPGSVGR